MKNPFKEPGDTGVIVCKHVLDHNEDIGYVSHDKDDGCWQFLCVNSNSHVVLEDARFISIDEAFEKDPSIGELAYLPIGASASRENKESNWEINLNNDSSKGYLDIESLTKYSLFKNISVEHLKELLLQYTKPVKGDKKATVNIKIASIPQAPEWLVVEWSSDDNLDDEHQIFSYQNVTFYCADDRFENCAETSFILGIDKSDPVLFANKDADDKKASIGLFKNHTFRYSLEDKKMDISAEITSGFEMFSFLQHNFKFDFNWIADASKLTWEEILVPVTYK